MRECKPRSIVSCFDVPWPSTCWPSGSRWVVGSRDTRLRQTSRASCGSRGKLGAQFDFEVVGIPAVTLGNGEPVSSTAIRHAVEAGDLAKAAEMLGREYTILGTVVRGDDLGKKIGFPTANLSAHSEQFPPNGVYFAEATLEGSVYPGVVNLGYRPTVSSGESERVLEIHLLDFDRDIYRKDVEVRFIRYLRAEQKFENVDALVRQIELDVHQARKLCAV